MGAKYQVRVRCALVFEARQPSSWHPSWLVLASTAAHRAGAGRGPAPSATSGEQRATRDERLWPGAPQEQMPCGAEQQASRQHMKGSPGGVRSLLLHPAVAKAQSSPVEAV